MTITPTHEYKLLESSGPFADTGDSVENTPGTDTGTDQRVTVLDYGRVFDNTTDKIVCGNPTDLQITTQDFSLAVYFHTYNTSASSRTLAAKGKKTDGFRSWSMDIMATGAGTPNCLNIELSGNGTNVTNLNGLYEITDDEYHIAILTRSGTTYKLYIDSALVNETSSGPASLFNTGENFVIGNDGGGSAGAVSCVIDQVQFYYNRVLSDSEIESALYVWETIYVADQDPAPDETGVATDHHVLFSLNDEFYVFDTSETTVTIHGVVAYSSDDFRNGFTGTVTPNGIGFDFELIPPSNFPPEHLIGVDIHAVNTAGQIFNESYSFTTEEDITVPSLQNQDPAPLATNVDKDTQIYAEIYDEGFGVDADTIEVYVDTGAGSALIYDSSGFKLGYTGTVVPDPDEHTYKVTATPPADFDEMATISVRVVADDLDPVPNHMDTTYTFYIASYPFFDTPLRPLPDATNVWPLALITFKVKDLGTGIDNDSIHVEVEGEVVLDGGVFASGFTGAFLPILDGVQVRVQTEDPYPDYTLINISVDAANDNGREVHTEWSFTTGIYDTDDPFLTALYPKDGSGDALPSTEIRFILRDLTTGVDVDSISATLNGVSAIHDGVIQSGFTGSITVDGSSPTLAYRVVIQPDEPLTSVLVNTLYVYCTDLDTAPKPHEFEGTYTFRVSVQKPIAIIKHNRIKAFFGSIIQLDGRESYDPNGLPITFTWTYTRLPIGSELNTFQEIRPNMSAVSFVPDKSCTYEVTLVINNGLYNSDPEIALVEIGTHQVSCGSGLIPDASFLWNAISNFWDIVEDREKLESLWSATIQLLGAEYVKLWANDYGKSLNTIRETVPRHWQQFKTYTDILDEPQRIIVGYNLDGTNGKTRAVEPVDRTFIVSRGSDDPGQTFTNTMTLPTGSIIVPGTVKVWVDADQVLEDDGLGTLDAVGGYGAYGEVDYATGYISIVENPGVVIWNGETDVVSTYQTASEYTDQFYLEAGTTDLTVLDTNKNAKGRVLFVNGDGYTVSRVYNTADASVIIVDEVVIPGGLSNATWRIPQLLHVPSMSLEDFKVCTGDIIEFDVFRKDLGVRGVLRAQVVGVDRDRVGFEFTLSELSPGCETIDREQFRQLVKDLKIVSHTATEDEISAAVETLISFIPTGVNIATRPFTPYRLVLRARRIVHNSALRVYSGYVYIPALQDTLYDPSLVLKTNYEYILNSGEILFQPGVFSLSNPPPDELWAECTMVDNTPVIESNFGKVIGVTKESLDDKITRVSYLSAVKGLWYAILNGPTVANIRLGLQILFGLPYAEERGLILSIIDGFTVEEGGLELTRLLVEDLDEFNMPTGRRRIYFYPTIVGMEINPVTGVEYAEKDIVEKWSPISKGVVVEDYVKDPLWWKRVLTGQEILKYFIFRAVVMAEVFSSDDVTLAVEFLRKIKPAYVAVITTASKSLSDDILADFEEEIYQKTVTSRFYDTVGSVPPAFRPDQINRQGLIAWNMGSHPFVLRTTNRLLDVTTREGTGPYAGKVVAECPSGFATVGGAFQQHLGEGTAGLNDTFTDTLGILSGSVIEPWSVRVVRDGLGSPGTGVQVARDNGEGYVSGTGVSGTVGYTTRSLNVAEAGQQIWILGESADVDFHLSGSITAPPFRGRARPDPALGGTLPSVEGDILVIFRGQPGSSVLHHGFYEIETVISNTEVVLRNFACVDDPASLVLGESVGDPGYLDASSFPYGEDLRCCVVRRFINPIVCRTGLEALNTTNNVRDTGATFIKDGVCIDDHIIIEGSPAAEYRISSIDSETQMSVTGMDGVNPSFTGDTGLSYRIIKPFFGPHYVTGIKTSHVPGSPDTVVLEAMDLGDPSAPPRDIFSPELVGHEVVITSSQNPANDGKYTITEYVHAGKVVTNATYSAGASDTTASAILRIGPKYTSTTWSSGWHRGFEQYDELFPVEVVGLELTT